MRRKPKVKRLSSKGSPLCPLERDEHNRVIAWAKLMVSTGQEPRLRFLRSGFEGIRLTMGVRMQVKRQSVSRGFPDLVLYVPVETYQREIYHALFIELKRVKGGVISAEQKEMMALLVDQGYCVKVCRGADEAIKCISDYLGV